MATDVDVQYFSHLNGLTLGNNWGDLIRLLDKALVTGIDFTQITAASIDAQGDVHITLYAAHNAMLFQVVELTGFTPASFNQKYRIKGAPSTTELILKPHTAILETTISTFGLGRLASLGYEIIFRDTNDVKRVYRAKNPNAQHPYIRVDESIASDAGTYTSTYAKYAMAGLLEHMDHIDDYQNTDVLQLPFDPADLGKNWKITGSGSSVVRGWNKWYYNSTRPVLFSSLPDTDTPSNTAKNFFLIGDSDAFYLVNAVNNNEKDMICNACGLFDSSLKSDVIPNWFLTGVLDHNPASENYQFRDKYGATPFASSSNIAAVSKKILTPNYLEVNRLAEHSYADCIVPDYYTGKSGLYNESQTPAIDVPIHTGSLLKGTLKHIAYSGKVINSYGSVISGNSMYLQTPIGMSSASNEYGGYYFYLGEIE